MAAPSLSHPVSQHQTITQFQLARYLRLQDLIEQLEGEHAKLYDALTTALSAGSQVEPGDHTAWLETHERRSVAWKEIVVSLKGERYADSGRN